MTTITKPTFRGLITMFVLIFCAIAFGFALTSCGDSTDDAKQTVHIVVPDGAPLLPITSMIMGFDDSVQDGKLILPDELSDTLGKSTEINVVSGADQLASLIKQSKPEIVFIPVNLASKLYNEAEDSSSAYKLAGVTTWGLNSIVSNAPISSLTDLKGKKLYTYGKSEVPGIVLRTLLTQAGVSYTDADTSADVTSSADSVTLVDFTLASDITDQLIKDKANPDVYAMLPEPVASVFATKQAESYPHNLSLQSEWKKYNSSENYPMAGVAVRADFADNVSNQTYISTFMTSLDLGAQLAFLAPQSAVDVAREQLGSKMFADTSGAAPAAIGEGRLPIDYLNVAGGIESLFKKNNLDENRAVITTFLQLLLDNSADNGKMIGGKVPNDNFFVNIDLSAIKLLQNSDE